MVVLSDPPIREANESLELRFSVKSKELDPVEDHATVKGWEVQSPRQGRYRYIY
jgi:hypothetical protein